VLSKLKGKSNVIQLLDLFYSFDSKQRIIQNAVFEFCDMSLEDVLQQLHKENRYMELKEMKRIMRQLLTGLKNMHEQKILHRDLKPENILMKDGEVKICDLGSSKILDDETFMNTPYVVSRFYRAPELILGTNKYDAKIDIWGKSTIINP
jgi:glycogen synthase kinase 3 beta